MNDFLDNEDLREIVADKLEQIRFQKELAGLKTQVSFLERMLAKTEMALAQTENNFEKERKSKETLFQNTFFQMKTIDNLQKENSELKKKLTQTKKTIIDAGKIVGSLCIESFPPCERKTFQNLKDIFKKEDVNEKQYQLFEKEIKKRGLRALKTETIG